MKCIGNCASSIENNDVNENFKDNKDIIYVRFKNNNKTYKYYDYMLYQDREFQSDFLGDFILYKNFNDQYTDSFKRVIDDDVFGVTHIIENKVNINHVIYRKHLILLRMLY